MVPTKQQEKYCGKKHGCKTVKVLIFCCLWFDIVDNEDLNANKIKKCTYQICSCCCISDKDAEHVKNDNDNECHWWDMLIIIDLDKHIGEKECLIDFEVRPMPETKIFNVKRGNAVWMGDH